MVFFSNGLICAYSDSGRICSLSELAGHFGNVETFAGGKWICIGAIDSGTVIYVLRLWANFLFVFATQTRCAEVFKEGNLSCILDFS